MKKFLLSLAAVVLGFTAMSAAEITWDFQNETYGMTRLSGATQEYNDDPLTITNGVSTINATGHTRLWSDGFRIYTGSTFSVSVSEGTISKIQFVNKTGGAVTSNIALVDESQGALASGAWTGSATKVDFKATQSSGNQHISKIIITTVGGSAVTKDDAELSFPEKSYTVKQGEEFTAPSLSKATDAAPVYTSSEESVATVNASTGAVTIVGKGTTVITATCAATDDFYAGSAKYTLVVLDANTFWAPDCTDTANPEFTFETLSGDFQPWKVDGTYGLKASAYSNSKANASDAVAASPVLDFTGYEAPMSLEYRHAVNQFKLNDVMIGCTDENLAQYVSIVAKEEGATEWTKIGAVTAPGSFSWNYVDGTSVNLSAYAGKKVQLGFRYVSTDECAGTWEIDNVVVFAKKSADAVESIVVDENAPVEYYNLQGVRVANPTNGLYIVRQGNKVSKQLVK